MSKPNQVRSALFEKPDFIPMTFVINDSCWKSYDQNQLCDLIESHPFLFPDFKRPALPYTPDYALVARKDAPYTDDFGCVWQTTIDGITGCVVKHPLSDLDVLPSYRWPDPDKCMGIGPIDWNSEKVRLEGLRKEGKFAPAGLRHGHTFLQLCDLHGYEDLLCDMVDEDDRLWPMIEGLESFNQAIVDHYLDIGVDQMSYAEDLGMQVGPMISPDLFRKYIKPSYSRLMKKARDKGVLIHMHSDGDIRTLVSDLVEGGVQVINLQDKVNGIDWIADHFAHRTCVELDIDRQDTTLNGTPAQIDEMIADDVKRLSSPDGGLWMIYGLYPQIPIENAKALMDAMTRYAFFWS
jgi:hypothetical protein